MLPHEPVFAAKLKKICFLLHEMNLNLLNGFFNFTISTKVYTCCLHFRFLEQNWKRRYSFLWREQKFWKLLFHCTKWYKFAWGPNKKQVFCNVLGKRVFNSLFLVASCSIMVRFFYQEFMPWEVDYATYVFWCCRHKSLVPDYNVVRQTFQISICYDGCC